MTTASGAGSVDSEYSRSATLSAALAAFEHARD
jgi:hypothetical protein